MTYKESYLACKSIEEIESAAMLDIYVAKKMISTMTTTDRIGVILKSAEEAINEKFNKNVEVEE